MEIYEGGCLCGNVRFELADHPAWVVVCHCNACKKRTGSDYAVSVLTASDNVKEFTGEIKIFIRKAESGNEVTHEFCPNCGTTIRWTFPGLPGREAIAGGAFDNVENLKVAGEMYAGAKAPWVDLGCEVSRPEAPDDTFRQELIENTKSLRDRR